MGEIWGGWEGCGVNGEDGKVVGLMAQVWG